MPGARASGIDDIADSMTQDLRSVAVQSRDPFFKGERQELPRVPEVPLDPKRRLDRCRAGHDEGTGGDLPAVDGLRQRSLLAEAQIDEREISLLSAAGPVIGVDGEAGHFGEWDPVFQEH